MSGGIEYVEIAVSDVKRSARWYEETLGLGTLPAAIRFVPAGGGTSGWVNDNRQRGVRHIAFKVADADADAHAERLRAAGAQFAIEPMDAIGDVRITFFFDPDGTLLELVAGAVQYHRTASPELAAREAETLPAPGDAPRFDHVAVTVGDLDAALRRYRDDLGFEVVGQLLFGDEQGFAITYLRAGEYVLELFSFDAATSQWPSGGGGPGFRAIGIGGDRIPAHAC